MLSHEINRYLIKLLKSISTKLEGHVFINAENDDIDLLIDSVGFEIFISNADCQYREEIMKIDINSFSCNSSLVKEIFGWEIELNEEDREIYGNKDVFKLTDIYEELANFNQFNCYSLIGDGKLSNGNSLISDSFLVQDFLDVFPTIEL